MSTLSVIVPVYNVEKYLEKCVHSILGQTYQNLQIILVNDGSTDSSASICNKFAEQDVRVNVIHQENKGLAGARWAGVQKADGEYTIWVDSDDWVESDYFEKMMCEAVKQKSDLVAADLYFDIGETTTVIKNNIASGNHEVSEIIGKLLYFGNFYEYGIQPHGVTKLFKTEILRSVQEEMDFQITIGEDAAIVYPYILKCESITVTDICGYHYIQRNDSMTKKRNNKEIEKIERLILYLNEKFARQEQLLRQLKIYKNYLLALHDLSFWDDRELLFPFGGLDKIAIYGAGGMGQSLYAYCKKHGIPVAAWIDKNYEHYQSLNMPVVSLEDFKKIADECRYLFIANISGFAANNIKADLIKQGVNENKIRWFSQEFLEGC